MAQEGEQPPQLELKPVEEDEEASKPPSGEKKKEIEIPACPVHAVVVYPDRAEVERYIGAREW